MERDEGGERRRRKRRKQRGEEGEDDDDPFDDDPFEKNVPSEPRPRLFAPTKRLQSPAGLHVRPVIQADPPPHAVATHMRLPLVRGARRSRTTHHAQHDLARPRDGRRRRDASQHRHAPAVAGIEILERPTDGEQDESGLQTHPTHVDGRRGHQSARSRTRGQLCQRLDAAGGVHLRHDGSRGHGGEGVRREADWGHVTVSSRLAFIGKGGPESIQ